MSKEPKTTEQINTDKLLLWINRYLTRRFIADPTMLPDDECSKEAKVILDKCREQIWQQLIEEIENKFKYPEGSAWEIAISKPDWRTFKRGE